MSKRGFHKSQENLYCNIIIIVQLITKGIYIKGSIQD